MPFVEVDRGRVTIHYQTYGEGPCKVLFIAGLATELDSWYKQIAYFTHESRKHLYTICCLDNRGFGFSTVPTSGPYSTRRMAKDALEVIDRALCGKQFPTPSPKTGDAGQISPTPANQSEGDTGKGSAVITGAWENFHVVGLSMGGMIAQELTLLALNRVLSLSLLSTHAGNTVVPRSGLTQILLNYRPGLSPRQYANFLLPLLYSQTWLDQYHVDDQGVQWRKKNRDMVLDELEESKKKHPESFLGVAFQVMGVLTHNVSPARLQLIKNSRIPVLIITGTDDSLVKPSNSYSLREVLQPEQFLVIEGAGHMIHREAYSQVNLALHRHFQLHQNRFKSSL